MDVRVYTVAQRPELKPDFDDPAVDPWPEFMQHDPIGDLYYSDVRSANPEFALMAVEAGNPDRVIASAYSVPFAWDGDPSVGELPVDGWDGVIRRAAVDRQVGRQPNLVSALEISVPKNLQGRGLSGLMLSAMRDNAARLGFGHLVAPVRPTQKHQRPNQTIEAYAAETRDDGLPVDSWLRVHVRAGGTIVGTCPRAMVIPGTLDEWRSWTGLPFDTTGDLIVPKALVPVHCDVEHNHAVYVEPGVWVHHPLA